MDNKTALVVTSVSSDTNSVLNFLNSQAAIHDIAFLVIGDEKSPKNFSMSPGRFVSIEEQRDFDFNLVEMLPENHYSRKNVGYLLCMTEGFFKIIETDDDNLPYNEFWAERVQSQGGRFVGNKKWINAYSYFCDHNIWPRGFPLQSIANEDQPIIEFVKEVNCPIQQGLADKNPDVDAIYRLTSKLPIVFDKEENLILAEGSYCPFNSQNTTWFKESFPLLYLPSYCSFRMTDIWRSFIAQRILPTCNWHLCFTSATMYQERNEHNLMKDFKDEIPGYLMNAEIINLIEDLNLKEGVQHIYENLSEFYVEKAIEKQKATYDLIKAKTDSIKVALNAAEYRLAKFKDSNQRLWTRTARLEEERLSREIQLLILMYGESVKNLEFADFSLKTKTPFIQLIDAPLPPLTANQIHKGMAA